VASFFFVFFLFLVSPFTEEIMHLSLILLVRRDGNNLELRFSELEGRKSSRDTRRVADPSFHPFILFPSSHNRSTREVL